MTDLESRLARAEERLAILARMEAKIEAMDKYIRNGFTEKINTMNETVNLNARFREFWSKIFVVMLITFVSGGVMFYTWDKQKLETEGRLQTPTQKEKIAEEVAREVVRDEIKKALDEYFKDKK